MCTGRPVEGCALRRLVFYGGADHWDLLPAQLPVARAMRLIADGVVDREGVDGLAARLGYSVRQVERQLRAELGAGPLALARAERAQTARVLIETSTLPMTQIALAAGFASIRAFNETVQEVFVLSPTELRGRAARGHPPVAPGSCRCACRSGRRFARTTFRPPRRYRGARGRGVARRGLPQDAAPAARSRDCFAATAARSHRRSSAAQ